MKSVQIEFLTDDPHMRELCEKYWLTDDEGKPIHYVKDLAEQFGLTVREVPAVLSEHCLAFVADLVCKRCDGPVKYVTSRSDASSTQRYRERYELCDDCRMQVREQEEEQARDEEEAFLEQKEALMRQAFKGGVYESLNPLEFNFLVALATSENVTKARKKVGLSEKDATSLVHTLDELHLIYHEVGTHNFVLLNELCAALKKIGLQRRVKPIFGSPKAHELYRLLKRDHLFVYPEIPICAFVDRAQVEHLFSENWHAMYFLTARVDFVVCDPGGKPEIAFEYQGGYHQSDEQKEKDDFKRAVLNEIGLSIREVISKDLRDPDEF